MFDRLGDLFSRLKDTLLGTIKYLHPRYVWWWFTLFPFGGMVGYVSCQEGHLCKRLCKHIFFFLEQKWEVWIRFIFLNPSGKEVFHKETKLGGGCHTWCATSISLQIWSQALGLTGHGARFMERILRFCWVLKCHWKYYEVLTYQFSDPNHFLSLCCNKGPYIYIYIFIFFIPGPTSSSLVSFSKEIPVFPSSSPTWRLSCFSNSVSCLNFTTDGQCGHRMTWRDSDRICMWVEL